MRVDSSRFQPENESEQSAQTRGARRSLSRDPNRVGNDHGISTQIFRGLGNDLFECHLHGRGRPTLWAFLQNGAAMFRIRPGATWQKTKDYPASMVWPFQDPPSNCRCRACRIINQATKST